MKKKKKTLKASWSTQNSQEMTGIKKILLFHQLLLITRSFLLDSELSVFHLVSHIMILVRDISLKNNNQPIQ